jgi:hypothetical protein
MSVTWSSAKEPEADEYVTTVSVPEFDNGRQALHQTAKEGPYPPQNEPEAS